MAYICYTSCIHKERQELFNLSSLNRKGSASKKTEKIDKEEEEGLLLVIGFKVRESSALLEISDIP